MKSSPFTKPRSVRAHAHYHQRSSKVFAHSAGRATRTEFQADEPEYKPRTKAIKYRRSIGPMPAEYRAKIIREMKLRGLAEASIEVYVESLRYFMHRFRGKKPSDITLEDIETYVLELIDRRQAHRYINIQVTAIRFFYVAICAPCFHVADLPKLKERRKLPIVFTRDEVQAIINGAENLKHKCMLTMMYSTGIRAFEVASIKVEDLDLDQGLLHIANGKGGKDRYVPIAKKMLPLLKEYMRRRSPQNEYLFANDSSLYSERRRSKLASEYVIKIFKKAKKTPKSAHPARATH